MEKVGKGLAVFQQRLCYGFYAYSSNRFSLSSSQMGFPCVSYRLEHPRATLFVECDFLTTSLVYVIPELSDCAALRKMLELSFRGILQLIDS